MNVKSLKKDAQAVFDLAKASPVQADKSEKAVLAAMVTSRKARERALVLLGSEQFFDISHQHLFELLAQMRETKKGNEKVSNAMDSKDWAEEKVEFHAARVKDAYLRRKLLDIAMGIAYNTQCDAYETDELIVQARTALETLEKKMAKNPRAA